MKKASTIAVSLLFTVAFLGCGTASREIAMKSQSEKAEIFTEVNIGDTPPNGSVDVAVKATIKTHMEGFYALESKESLHGKQGYPFVFNIDGQGVTWKVDGVKEVKPAYNPDGTTNSNAEAGEGIRYVLEKKLRIGAGTHRVYFGLPEDKYAAEFEIILKGGETSTLELKPVYRTKEIPMRIPTFLKGIDRYEVFLNNKRIF